MSAKLEIKEVLSLLESNKDLEEAKRDMENLNKAVEMASLLSNERKKALLVKLLSEDN